MKKRIKSKTHWAAAILAALAVLEASSGSLSLVLGEHSAAIVGLAAAVVMAMLREVTVAPIQGSIGDKMERDEIKRLLTRR